MNRREFLLAMAATGVAGRWARAAATQASSSDALGAVLPGRALGQTGETVTMLGLGGFHIGWTTETRAARTIEAALEEGVRFFDTAESYGNGRSEARYGQHLVPRYRDDVFLMTKTTASDAATARKHLEGSLRRLRTERIDLWQLHALRSPDDADRRIDERVLDVAQQARDEGKVRHIGFTGHADPAAHSRMLERAGDAFATCQMPINPVDAAADRSFIGSVLPAAMERGCGVLAMKTLADGRFFGRKVVNDRVTWQTDAPLVPRKLSVADCIHFSFSLPIAVLITGAEKPQFLREKAGLTRSFAQLDETQRMALIARVADDPAAAQVEYYKR